VVTANGIGPSLSGAGVDSIRGRADEREFPALVEKPAFKSMKKRLYN
jgi:hypothetical protein